MARKTFLKRAISCFTAMAIATVAMPVIPAFAETGATTYSFDGYDVEYSVKNEWTEGQSIEVKITNTGDEPILNWAFQYETLGEIQNIWNADVYSKNENSIPNKYVVKNSGWNYEIKPEQSIIYGYTLIGNNLCAPTEFELVTKRVDKTYGFDVKYETESDWGSGFQGKITLTNTSDKPVEAWTLKFTSNFNINNLWNGRIVDNNECIYSVSSEMWTNPLLPGKSIDIGFIGSKDEQAMPNVDDFKLSEMLIEENIENDVDLSTSTIDLGYIEDLIESGMISVVYDKSGNLRTIDGKFTDKIVNNENDAAWVLNAAASLFGSRFNANASDITIQQLNNECFYKYNPSINGVIVDGSQIILATANCGVTGLFSTYNSDIENVNMSNSLNEESAVNIALNDFESKISGFSSYYAISSGVPENEVSQILIDSISISASKRIEFNNGKTPELMWVVELNNNWYYDDDDDDDLFIDVDFDNIYDYGKYLLSGISYTYYIYANGDDSGKIFAIETDEDCADWESTTYDALDYNGHNQTISVKFDSDNNVYKLYDEDRKIKTYYVGNNNTLPGNIVKLKDNAWHKVVDAVSAHSNLEYVYDFYNDVLDWESYDNKGSMIKISLNCLEWDKKNNKYIGWKNAKWDPKNKQILVGNKGNFFAAKDIIGHEFTHAVTKSIVGNMGKAGESGALKEAYADIMGSLIENKTDDGKWKIGEDSGNEVRNMSKPKVSQYTKEVFENGKIHDNSTLFSYVAYLMMSDKNCKDITNNEWAILFFDSMFRLCKDSNFLDARSAVLSSASYLEFTNSQQEAIKNAFDKVNITEPDTIRIVLRWGEKPSDLDSHLIGPKTDESSKFHIYYGSRSYYDENQYNDDDYLYIADLDYDDTTAFGPEIISIKSLTNGEYYYYVHDFSNRNRSNSYELSNSKATVTIFKGSSKIPLMLNGKPAYFMIKPNNSGTLWTVFKIIVKDGAYNIYFIDEYSNCIESTKVGA